MVSSSPPTSRESHSNSDVRNNASTDQAPIQGLTESPAPPEPHKVSSCMLSSTTTTDTIATAITNNIADPSL